MTTSSPVNGLRDYLVFICITERGPVAIKGDRTIWWGWPRRGAETYWWGKETLLLDIGERLSVFYIINFITSLMIGCIGIM